MNTKVVIFFLGTLFQICQAFPSPAPEYPFSVSLRNARSSESNNSNFSLQDSVARILRALTNYGYPEHVAAAATSSFLNRNGENGDIRTQTRHSKREDKGSMAVFDRNNGISSASLQFKSDSEAGLNRNSRSRVIVSQPLRITEGTRGSGRSLKNIDVQGVRVIVGQRVPDDPQDKFFTWRNARVIKGVLVPSAEDMQNVMKNVQ